MWHMRWPTLAVTAVLVCCAMIGVSGAQTPPATVADLTLGTSAQGRPITALRVGSDPRKLVLVGAVHGGPERNTFALATELAAHFRDNPSEVPAEVSLYIIPTLNPDGLALDVRQNANGVDLNRNMDTSADACPENDWRHQVAGAYGIISDTGGPYSESEVESRLIRDFLLDASGVIFFHTSGGVVFPACSHPPSQALGQVFARGSGYAFIPTWDRYLITGGMHDWAGGLGIAAITPELVTGDQPETAANLAGVRAVLREAERLLPLPEPRMEQGVAVNPVIWRSWRAWGGESLFGLPLGRPLPAGHGWRQIFERAVFDYQPAHSDTTYVVQIEALGRQVLVGPPVAPAEPRDGARFFTETGHTLSGQFAAFWQINGGLPIFGFPLTEEEQTTNSSGQRVFRQVFERAVLERPVDASRVSAVSMAALGRIYWAQFDARSPHTGIRAR